MGNHFTNEKAVVEALQLSNSATQVLLDVLTISASDLATTQWEKRFAVWVAEHDQTIRGLGIAGFDVDEIGWTVDEFENQKVFTLKAIDMALQEHRWNTLPYSLNSPTGMKEQIKKFRGLVEAFNLQFIDRANSWLLDGEYTPNFCQKHQVYMHEHGCIICNAEVDVGSNSVPPP